MTVTYEIADAVTRLEKEPAASAQLVHLDDAWARPKRNGAFGVEYPTHAFSRLDGHYDDLESDLTVIDVLGACWRVLAPGGSLLLDADDWLLANVVQFLDDWLGADQWAHGGSVALSKDGTPDRSTPGQYLSTGGYHVILVQKQACPAGTGTYTAADRQRQNYGWGSAKPIRPYAEWLRQLTAPADRIIVPCAGTAPVAIAAEQLHGDQADVLCIDIEEGARDAYVRRRADELGVKPKAGGGS